MKKTALVGLLVFFTVILTSSVGQSQRAEEPQGIPVSFEELTAPEFLQSLKLSGGTCLLPLGIMEKHGPHLPLGTDLLTAREIALRAAKKEYAVVFPPYYFGQIFEAKHQPGTLAYSSRLIWNILDETCRELARNGLKKIILVNGHGGNEHFLPFFCQAQLESEKDFAVLLFSPETDPEVNAEINKLRKTTTGGHADEVETSQVLAIRADLVHTERGADQSGEDLDRLRDLPYAYTGIWWYAKYPNHYAGDGSHASRTIGELKLNNRVNQLVKLLKVVKSENTVQNLQERFFREAKIPEKTKQK